MTQIAVPYAGTLTIVNGYQDQNGLGTVQAVCQAMADLPSYPPARNDNTYAKSPSESASAVFWAYCYESLTAKLGNPGVSAGNILNLVCRKSVVTDPATYRVTKDLYEGYREGVTDGTLIASLVVDPAPNILTLYQHELTTDEYNAIGDWGDLWFRYETTKY